MTTCIPLSIRRLFEHFAVFSPGFIRVMCRVFRILFTKLCFERSIKRSFLLAELQAGIHLTEHPLIAQVLQKYRAYFFYYSLQDTLYENGVVSVRHRRKENGAEKCIRYCGRLVGRPPLAISHELTRYMSLESAGNCRIPYPRPGRTPALIESNGPLEQPVANIKRVCDSHLEHTLFLNASHSI